MNFEVFFNYEDFANILNIYIIQNNPDGTRRVCTDLGKMEFEPYTEGMELKKSSLHLSGSLIIEPFLQAFANGINKLGIRPEDSPVLENELSAVKNHLADMQKIVFNQLNIIQ